MDPIVLTIVGVSVTLTILLVAIGIQVYLILKEVRSSVEKTNKMLDDAGKVSGAVSDGVVHMSGFMTGIRTGVSFISKIINKGDHDE